MSSESILELTLGGFQVFAEPVTCPLGPITLLFGPNSAGKSAIADALQVLSSFSALFDDGARDSESEILQKAASLLESHWRREPGTPPMRVPEVQLGIRIRVAREFNRRFDLAGLVVRLIVDVSRGKVAPERVIRHA